MRQQSELPGIAPALGGHCLAPGLTFYQGHFDDAAQRAR